MVKDTLAMWYLIYTKPNHEEKAKLNLERQGFHTYLPMLQQHKHRRNVYRITTSPLFPRYLFVRLDIGADDWSKIRSTLGCIALVRFGVFPARVPNALIEQLKNGETSRFIRATETTPDFKPGDRVRVIDGVMENYEGILQAKNSQQRVTLLLTIAEGHTCLLNLSAHQVKVVV